MTPLFAAVLGYLVLQFGIGIWVSRRIRNEADYLLAGRRLGYPLMIFTIFATWFGAETLVGSAGKVYREGISLTSAEPFGYALCLFLMGLVFAAPLWNRKLTTLADLFRGRYSVGVERLAALILIPSSLLWAAAQMRAFGHVLVTTTTLPLSVALLLASAFCILYTAFGGLLADAITDLVQGVLLVAGLLVLLGAVVLQLGGVANAVTAVVHSGRVLPAEASAPFLRTLEAWAIPVCGSVVATELVARIIAARSPRIARRSSFAAGALYLTVGLIPVLIALAAPHLAGDVADREQFLPAVARELLPTWGYAIFAGGLISAILSTVDSTLLVPSGLLSHNLLAPLLGTRDQATMVRFARMAVVVFGLMAYVLALRSEGVFALVEQASAFGSTGSLVTVCFGLFTSWGGPRTAAATLVGGVVSYLWASLGGLLYPFLTSLAVALAIYVVGALLEGGVGRERARGSPSGATGVTAGG